MFLRILKSNDTWYGMPYKEDCSVRKGELRKQCKKVKYVADIFVACCHGTRKVRIQCPIEKEVSQV